MYIDNLGGVKNLYYLCGGYTEIPRDLRVIYEHKLVKMAFHQELVGKILSSSPGFLLCYLSEGRKLLAITRPYGTVQNGRETRGWLVCRLQVPHTLVVSHSRTRMSLGTDVTRHS